MSQQQSWWKTTWRVVSGTFTFLAAVLGVWTGANAATGGSENIKRSTAESFAELYAAVAVGNPDYAHAEFTTEPFQASRRGRQPEFREFWSKVDKVDGIVVRRAADGDKNNFDVSYNIDYTAGTVEPVSSSWHLVCDNWVRSWLPLADCRAKDLRLNDVVRLQAARQ